MTDPADAPSPPPTATAAPDPVRQRASATDVPARPLDPGLYLVATPIGAAADITLRALDVLARVDLLAAEDTRRARQLLDIHGVALAGRRLLPYHDHNGPAARPALMDALAAGARVAYVSDAGTPLLADPGFRLVQDAIAAGHAVHAVPGASALLAALTVAGLPTDRFLFAGFPPPRAAARAAFLAALRHVPATLVFYEAPHRTAETVVALRDALGDRPAALCRELTKRFEEVRRASLSTLADALAAEGPPRGEVVLVVGPPTEAVASADDIDAALRAALATLSVKDAASAVAEATGAPRRDVYARALRLAGGP